MNTVRFDGEDVVPSKIVCVGRNYAEHIEELGNTVPGQAVIFCKPNSAISGSVRFDPQHDIHYEGEISFIVRAGKIAGVGLGLDLTMRDVQQPLQQQGLPWERAKSFDGAACFSQFVGFNGVLAGLELELTINGELKQRGGYDLMLHKPEFLLEDIGGFMTLEDNDILMTGTPRGVGPIKAGDEIRGSIRQNGTPLVEARWQVQSVG
jgi:2-keto-4-pentenoate hydratase/2-oxohepta-3-ene-1,7-dioic acid hydratase in catechol pathway